MNGLDYIRPDSLHGFHDQHNTYYLIISSELDSISVYSQDATIPSRGTPYWKQRENLSTVDDRINFCCTPHRPVFFTHFGSQKLHWNPARHAHSGAFRAKEVEAHALKTKSSHSLPISYAEYCGLCKQRHTRGAQIIYQKRSNKELALCVIRRQILSIVGP